MRRRLAAERRHARGRGAARHRSPARREAADPRLRAPAAFRGRSPRQPPAQARPRTRRRRPARGHALRASRHAPRRNRPQPPDPRANLLLKLARERGVGGPHVAMLYALRDTLPGAIGRSLPINVNGPIPAILLDLGWPLAALKGIGLLCRTAGLIGHLTEEAER